MNMNKKEYIKPKMESLLLAPVLMNQTSFIPVVKDDEGNDAEADGSDALSNDRHNEWGNLWN
jgi:hypothetical protein